MVVEVEVEVKLKVEVEAEVEVQVDVEIEVKVRYRSLSPPGRLVCLAPAMSDQQVEARRRLGIQRRVQQRC